MAISETITAFEESATTTVLNESSIVHITGNFTGIVKLQIAPAGTSNWVTLLTFANPDALPITTPDPEVLYRFIAAIRKGTANVYLGA